MAQDYLANFLSLNEERFKESLADEVSSVWKRVRGEVEGQEQEREGKEAVLQFYHDHFFAVTSQFHITEARYSSFGSPGYLALRDR